MSDYTPGPWQCVPSNEHHGPYVTSDYGSTICDCYVMSEPGFASTRNGGPSKPVHFMAEMADPNARLIAASPELLEAGRAVSRAAASMAWSSDSEFGRALTKLELAMEKATLKEETE